VTFPVNTAPGICLARYFLISKPSPINTRVNNLDFRIVAVLNQPVGGDKI
jgi:hypothetical protein